MFREIFTMKCYTYYNRIKGVVCLVMTLLLIAAAAVCPAAAFAQVSELTAIDGSAAILVDSRTGTVLYEQNADQPVAPASTTKIMTALLVVESVQRGQVKADDLVELTEEIMHDVPSDASRIGKAMVVGEQVSVRELLLMALMESDCVACDMLAVRVSGSVERFVEQMNLRAAQLGCRDTRFLNSHGYPTEGHTATARSLYLITREAAKHDMFMEAFGCLKYEMPATNMSDGRKLYSTDKLLYDPENISSTYTVYYNENVTGGKTGYSKASGNCLVSTAEKDGLELISVITGVEMKYPDTQTVIDAFTETDRLIRWGFDNYSSHQIVSQGQSIKQIDIENGEPPIINGICAESVYVTVEKSVSPNTIQVTSALRGETIAAPVSSGDVIGTVSLVRDGKVLASTDLIAAEDSPVAPKRFTPNIPLIIILSLLVAAGAGYLVYYTNNNNVLLLDLAMDKLGMSDNRKPVRSTQQKQIQRPAQKPAQPIEKEEIRSNPFDEFFARNGKQE